MYKEHPYDETRLFSLLKQGNEPAFTQLYHHHKGKIYAIALKMLKSPELAEEIVQEVFLKIWSGREKMGEVRNFENYLFIIARNHIFDHLKRTASETVAKNELSRGRTFESNTDFPVREKQGEELLARVVQLLPPQQKIVFDLARTEGLSHKNIAEQLQISPLTVKKHMAQALKFIRSHFQHHLGALLLLMSQWVN